MCFCSVNKAVQSREAKQRLVALNELHGPGASLQTACPHWYATQVSCFWTHSIHCHFDSNYKCNLGLLNDLRTMANERRCAEALRMRAKSLCVTGVIPALVSFFSPSFVLFLLHVAFFFFPRTNFHSGITGIRHGNLNGICGSEVIRAKNSHSAQSRLEWEWKRAHLCSVPAEETCQSLFLSALPPPDSSKRLTLRNSACQAYSGVSSPAQGLMS